jgi:hypothetical protein
MTITNTPTNTNMNITNPLADLVWTTRDGRMFRICEMTDSHLVNAINHILQREPQFIPLEHLIGMQQEINVRKHRIGDVQFDAPSQTQDQFREPVRKIKL